MDNFIAATFTTAIIDKMEAAGINAFWATAAIDTIRQGLSTNHYFVTNVSNIRAKAGICGTVSYVSATVTRIFPDSDRTDTALLRYTFTPTKNIGEVAHHLKVSPKSKPVAS